MTIIKHARIYIKTVTYNRIKTFLQVALMPLKGFEHQTQRKTIIKIIKSKPNRRIHAKTKDLIRSQMITLKKLYERMTIRDPSYLNHHASRSRDLRSIGIHTNACLEGLMCTSTRKLLLSLSSFFLSRTAKVL